MSFVVAGVSGNTGKVVAESLLAQKKSVKVIVRDAAKGEAWKAKGAEVAVADLADAAALGRALAGAEGAYLLIPPSFAEPNFRAYQDRITAAIAEAARTSKVKHVVLLSSIGAHLPSGTGPIAGLHAAETELRKITTTKWTFLRAAYFMENLGGSLGTLGEGAIASFLPAALAVDMIATVDIGKAAATLLLEGARETQVVDLAAPKTSMNDAAAAVSRIVGKPVRVQEAPLEAVVPAFTGMGMPKDLAELYHEMIGGFSQGRIAFEPGQRRMNGTTTVETVLRGLLAK